MTNPSKVAYDNNSVTDDMLDVIARLNESLPILDKDLDIFAESPRFHFQLQDLYDTYMDYCISCIQYIRRGAAGQ